MSKPKKREEDPRRPQPPSAARRRSRWADSVRTVALGVITACAQTYALILIAHIVGRR